MEKELPNSHTVSDSDSEYEETNCKVMHKFNLEEFEKRNFEHQEFLRAQLKGRRGIGNYDTFCQCFGDTDY